jgi:ketosteroid isomerase-like protein
MSRDELSPVEIVEKYWRHLDASEFEQAAAMFTEDVVYRHPPTQEHLGISTTEIDGREQLLEYWHEVHEARGGSKDVNHAVQRHVTEGDECAILGVASGADVDGVHVYTSFAEIEDGKIAYYSVCNRDAIV